MGCSTDLKRLSYRKALSIEFKIYEYFGPLGFKIGDHMVIVAGKQLSPTIQISLAFTRTTIRAIARKRPQSSLSP